MRKIMSLYYGLLTPIPSQTPDQGSLASHSNILPVKDEKMETIYSSYYYYYYYIQMNASTDVQFDLILKG